MGTGSSGSGSRGLSAGRSISDYDGSRIDMSHAPLKYGKDDASLKGAVKDVVSKFEDKRMKAKVEYGFLTDDKGNIITEKRGGKGGVAMYDRDWAKATVMSHIHPREAGMLGGSFSEADIDTFTYFNNVRTMRAVAKEGIYSMTKGKSFNASGLKSYFNQRHSELRAGFSKTANALNKSYKSGQIDYDTYYKRYSREFNKFLSDSHRMILDGQKKFGYTYTLERRRK